MTRQSQRATWVAGIIERHDNHVLIALPRDQADVSRLWQFPRGRLCTPESPEAAMRRVSREYLGIDVEIVVGQPPLECSVEGELAQIRYFICGVISGEALPGPYSEVRWIPRVQLLEYEFDDASGPVKAWMLDDS